MSTVAFVSLAPLQLQHHHGLAARGLSRPRLSSTVRRVRRTYITCSAGVVPPAAANAQEPGFRTRTEPTKKKSASALDVIRLAMPEWKALSAGVLASLLSSGILLLTPIAFGRVLDIVSSFKGLGKAVAMKELSRGASRLAIIYMIGAFFRLGEVSLMRIAGERIVASLRRRVFSKIVRSDVATLESTTTGELLSRLSSDTIALQRVMTDDVVKLTSGFLETLVGFSMLFLINVRLAAIVSFTLPLSVFAGIFYGGKTAKMAKGLSATLAKASQVASEQLNGIRIVKSFAREATAEAKYDAKIADVLALGHKAALADGLLQSWNRAIFSLNTCGILFLGGGLVAAGELTIGSMMAFVLYTSNLTAALNKLSGGIGEVIRASGAIDRVMMILGTRPKIEYRNRSASKSSLASTHAFSDSSDESAEVLAGEVEFRDVTFSYQNRVKPAVSNLSFSIPAGGSVALVGRSGSGKSTMLALLSRFYDPTSGGIFLDGRPLSDFDLRDLRQNVVGIVSQEAFLISGTLAENIGFGRAAATREEIEEAAEAAGVMDFARNLENGLDTVVYNLSGGEKQRLMIARCLAKQPTIMVLDEPTSALDRRSEAMVNATIERLMQDQKRTVILISHRLSIVRHCDRILVFESGAVVEEGSHEELLESDEAYTKLVAAGRRN